MSLLNLISVILMCIFQCSLVLADEKKFVIVIPSFNNQDWLERNLNSVFTQKYDNYRIIYINDASTDKTGELVEKYITKQRMNNRCTIKHNTKRRGALCNLYNSIKECNPREIVVCLDGDDWLSNENVLTILNKAYQNNNVWITYGQFSYYPIGKIGFADQLPHHIIEQNTIRDYPWVTSALRTFYAGLFHKIKREDLLDGDNNYFELSWDLAIMFPMLEMAGKNSKFIPDILYIYNITNQMDVNNNSNNPKSGREYQLSIDKMIRNRPKYKKIKNLFKLPENKKIYITTGHWGDLFDINNPVFNRDNCLMPTFLLRKALQKLKCDLVQTSSLQNLSNFDLIVTFDIPLHELGLLKNYPKEKLIAFLWEPISTASYNYDKKNHEHFSKIYSWCDDLIDPTNKKYFKFYYPVLSPMIEDVVNFENKKLCTLIACNKCSSYSGQLYTERKNIINFFEKNYNGQFEFYGRNWDKQNYLTYKGPIDQKVNYLKKYKFCICYENTNDMNGYVTEKIFDCFKAGTVPIYLGAPNITNYIPKKCFIDRRDFGSNEELYSYIVNITKTRYQEYIENIKQFLKTKEAQLFSIKNFINIFLRLIYEN